MAGRPLLEVFLVFLRLGFTAFGGPAAHVALMEEELVKRRQWLSREEFLDLLSAANLIPGPNSTELAIHLGLRRAGWPGLLAAGLAFIGPAAVMVWALAWAYVRYGGLPAISHLLDGMKPVLVAIVVQALWRLGRTAVKDVWLGLLGAAALGGAIAGAPELVVLFGAGLVGLAAHAGRRRGVFALTALAPGSLAMATPASLVGLFLVFLKIGAVLFGSGYVLVAFLRADLVERLHWITDAQLLDAVAAGQLTPGPLFTTATFVGYLVHRTPGALVATAGIFLPAFVLVAATSPLVPRLRRSALFRGFLDGVNVASLALMALVTWQLGAAALVRPWAWGVAIVSAIVLLLTRLSPLWLLAAGAAIGLLVQT